MDESIGSIENNNVNYQETKNDVIQIEPKKKGRGLFKKVLLVALVLVVLGGAYYIYSNTNLLKSRVSTIVETNTGTEAEQVKSPEYIFCEQSSGIIESIGDTGSGESYLCHLSDGIICDALLYYKGECPIIDNQGQKNESIEKKPQELYEEIPTNDVCDLDRPEREKKDGKLYSQGGVINTTEIDVSSFEVLDNTIAKDKNNLFLLNGGMMGCLDSLAKVPFKVDIPSFSKAREEPRGIFFTDNSNLYCLGNEDWEGGRENRLENLGKKPIDKTKDYKKYLDSDYIRIFDKIFINCQELKGVDIPSFDTINGLGKDKNYIYVGMNPIEGINVNSFIYSPIGITGNIGFIKDENTIYGLLPNGGLYRASNPFKIIKIDSDPSSFGLLKILPKNIYPDYDIFNENIFEDSLGHVFYGCVECGEGDCPIYDIVKVEGIDLHQIKIIENHLSNEQGIYGILEDDKYRYTIKCDQEQKVIRTSK